MEYNIHMHKYAKRIINYHDRYGWTFRKIGLKLKINHQQAHQIYTMTKFKMQLGKLTTKKGRSRKAKLKSNNKNNKLK